MYLRILSVLLMFLLAGCASSERMSRMSGGVFQEYSAPKSYRIRSEKFQTKTRKLEKGRNAPIGGIEGTPVNIWPFFFRSDHYTSILWPFIDWDDYGFAVRPFYNQEGDEHALLFPLSAWNPVSGDGWFLLAAWNDTGFGVIPFCWRHRDPDSFWYYYTPLLIHSEETCPLTIRKGSLNSFTLFLLGYAGRKMQIDSELRSAMLYRKFDPSLRRRLAWSFDGSGIPVPRNQAELEKMRTDPEIVKKLPVRESRSLGFIPLFHISYGEKETFCRMLCYLAGGESSERSFEWDFLGPLLARYRNSRIGEYGFDSHRIFASIPLMTYFSRDRVLKNEGCSKTIRQLIRIGHNWSGNVESFRKRIPEIRACLNILSETLSAAGSLPSEKPLELPAAVTDHETYRLFLSKLFRQEMFRKLKLEHHLIREGGFLPLFWFRNDEQSQKKYFFSFAGMTYFRDSPGNSSFWSLPLLTFHTSRSSIAKPKVVRYRRGAKVIREDSFGIAPPLIWYSDTEEWDRNDRPIQPHGIRWAEKSSWTLDRNDFSALGLYYHGRMDYYAVKRGVPQKTVESLRTGLPKLQRDAESNRGSIRHLRAQLARQEAEVGAEREKLKKDPKSGKVQLYKKLLAAEQSRVELERLEKCKLSIRADAVKLAEAGRKIGFSFLPEALLAGDKKMAGFLLDKLFEQYAELRSQEDFGSGFFYRKEIFNNGDFHWNLLGSLAGGEKNGDREHCHVLQFLYRFRRDGKNMEKVYFPFVSIRENGTGRRFSFLGRLYQRTVENGRISGYFLFIPF